MRVIKEAYREVQRSTAEKIRGAAVEVEGLSWTISPPTLPVGRESSRQPLSKCGGGSTHIRNIWDNYISADSQVPISDSDSVEQTPQEVLINTNSTGGKVATLESENWKMRINYITSFSFPLLIPQAHL